MNEEEILEVTCEVPTHCMSMKLHYGKSRLANIRGIWCCKKVIEIKWADEVQTILSARVGNDERKKSVQMFKEKKVR